MKAMVLCAGLGTRLRPLTERWPKPAIPLLGAPLFRYALAVLRRVGVTSVGINTHHLAEAMAASAEAECGRCGVRLEVARELVALEGTGGGIRGLRRFLDGSDFVVLNGDVLFAVDLAPVLSAHRASGAAATMVLLPMPPGATYNAVEVEPSGAVRRIAGRGPGGPVLAPWHFSGVHVMSPAVFDFMAARGAEDINHDVYPRMLARGLTVRGHFLPEAGASWSDLGTPERYAATHHALLGRQVQTAHFLDADPFLEMEPRGPGVWAHRSAAFEGAIVEGAAWLGAGSFVEPGAQLEGTVSIGPGARVGAGARLRRVAVLDGAEVAAGQRLADVIVAPGGLVVPSRSAEAGGSGSAERR